MLCCKLTFASNIKVKFFGLSIRKLCNLSKLVSFYMQFKCTLSSIAIKLLYSQMWLKFLSRILDVVILDFQSGKAKSNLNICKYVKTYYSSWFHISVVYRIFGDGGKKNCISYQSAYCSWHLFNTSLQSLILIALCIYRC